MCLNGKEFNAACSSGLIFDTISSKCSKPEESTCVRDNPCSNAVGVEYKPHQTDCNAYYMCMGQSLFKLTCSPGNSFDVTTRKCQSQARATCYGQTPQNNLVCVGISGVGSVPDPNDCTRYYLCINGQGHAQQCVPGLIFDVVTSQCNRPEVSVCVNEVVSPPTAAPAVQIPPVTPPPYVPAPIPAPMPAPIPAPVPVPSYPGTPYCTPGQEYYRSHPDCRKFYWCVYGTLHEKNCPPNQHWNPEREYCDYVWNARCSAY
ncbi:conserved hypothetical protein [Culex quinquefasciatus]|uniref:Chitin-binding type-2 domain-containing protein n=3 Tax=Culex quinquefasciatus TaxID=7176 RepID=B0WAB1_CULQU|nr:conserved hypothetical protein [Culex quinquefasciatus]|eukprot:XP_001845645.1 conserved hypothetical protein [Culex quinquefasciatus]